jgi:NitT/TauT family transport system substrate-binding protein
LWILPIHPLKNRHGQVKTSSIHVVSSARGQVVGRLALVLLAWIAGSSVCAAEVPVRVGALKFGTVNWELDVIRHHGLDRANGVAVQVTPLAGKSAASVALQGGAVDMIVGDWIWVSRQRAEGKRYTFFPYSVAVGGLMVDPLAIHTLSDLHDRKIGVAGGPVDKNWLLLQAYAKRAHGLSLDEVTDVVYGAPPLLNKLMLRGELDGVITFWHYGARLRANGKHPLVDIEAILRELGVSSHMPLLGWIFDADWADANATTVNGFLNASYAAKRILLESDAEWQRIQPLTRAENAQTLAVLRDGYRAGIPTEFGQESLAGARKIFGFLAAEGGSKLVGSSDSLSDGTFWQGFEPPP